MQIATTKTCKQCHQEKPLLDFYRDPDKRLGRQNVCKSCVRRIRRGEPKQPALPNAGPRPRGIPQSYKACSRCEGYFPEGSFYRNANAMDGLSSYCRNCSARIRESALADPQKRERLLEAYRRYYSSPKGKAKAISQNARRKAAGIGRKLPSNFAGSNVQYALDYWKGRCPVCNCEPDRWEWDHWIPLASDDCPGTVPSNVLPICYDCNRSKSDKDPLVWMTDTYGTEADPILDRIHTFFRAAAASVTLPSENR